MALAMSKRVEKVKLQLAKHNVPDWLKAQMKFELDDSGSAMPYYNNGEMQELVERLMAVALRLDADGKLEVYSFSDRAAKHGDVVESEIEGYIKQRFIPEAARFGTWSGGTNYAKAVTLALQEDAVEEKTGFLGKLFGSKKAATPQPNYPNVHLFVSDGEDMGDHQHFQKLVREATNDYFVLVGIGNAGFSLMKQTADRYDNVGFVKFSDLSISDDEMYGKLLDKELCDWLIKHQPTATA